MILREDRRWAFVNDANCPLMWERKVLPSLSLPGLGICTTVTFRRNSVQPQNKQSLEISKTNKQAPNNPSLSEANSSSSRSSTSNHLSPAPYLDQLLVPDLGLLASLLTATCLSPRPELCQGPSSLENPCRLSYFPRVQTHRFRSCSLGRATQTVIPPSCQCRRWNFSMKV